MPFSAYLYACIGEVTATSGEEAAAPGGLRCSVWVGANGCAMQMAAAFQTSAMADVKHKEKIVEKAQSERVREMVSNDDQCRKGMIVAWEQGQARLRYTRTAWVPGRLFLTKSKQGKKKIIALMTMESTSPSATSLGTALIRRPR